MAIWNQNTISCVFKKSPKKIIVIFRQNNFFFHNEPKIRLMKVGDKYNFRAYFPKISSGNIYTQ